MIPRFWRWRRNANGCWGAVVDLLKEAGSKDAGDFVDFSFEIPERELCLFDTVHTVHTGHPLFLAGMNGMNVNNEMWTLRLSVSASDE